MKIIKTMAFLLIVNFPYGQAMKKGPANIDLARLLGLGSCSSVVVHGGVFVNGQRVSMNDEVPLGAVRKEDKSELLTAAVTGIQLQGFGNVFLKQGEHESLIIEANENILPQVTTNIRRGILTLGTSGCFIGLVTLNFYITLRDIRQIAVSGSGNIAIQNDLRTPQLTVIVSGSGNVKIHNLITANFCATISGSGDVAVEGIADNQQISICGSGDYKGELLTTQNSNISICGSGDAAITSKNDPIYSIAGSGELRVNGHCIERGW